MNLIPRGDGEGCSACARSTWSPARASEAMLTIEVDLIEPLGADTLVYGHPTATARARRAAAASLRRREGKLPLRYAPANVHWFDAKSGARVEL